MESGLRKGALIIREQSFVEHGSYLLGALFEKERNYVINSVELSLR